MDTSSEPLTTPPNLAAQQKEKQVVQPREETSDDDDGDDDGDAEDQSRDGDRNGDRNGESKTLKPAKRANVSQNDKIAISRSVAQAARFLASQTNTTTKNNAVSKKRKVNRSLITRDALKTDCETCSVGRILGGRNVQRAGLYSFPFIPSCLFQ